MEGGMEQFVFMDPTQIMTAVHLDAEFSAIF